LLDLLPAFRIHAARFRKRHVSAALVDSAHRGLRV
jgi:hypothetical protein